jgi:hypothetical protein
MRTSTTSLNSEYNLEPQKPQATDFQLWRRRAAKLTHFFGVDYRELIDDVLDSIEKGVEEERKKGSINPDEFEVLWTLRPWRVAAYDLIAHSQPGSSQEIARSQDKARRVLVSDGASCGWMAHETS